jgi:hypothetical protein
VAERIREWTGLSEDDVTHSRAAYSGEDIILSAKARKLMDIWVECKNHKTLSIPEWLRQMAAGQKRNNREDAKPVLVFKQHGDGTMICVIPFDDYLELLTEKLNWERENG